MAWLRRFLLRLLYFCFKGEEEEESIREEEESNRQNKEESIREEGESIREEKEESRQSNEESIREEESKREEKEESIQSNEESLREEKESIRESTQSNEFKAKDITTLMPYVPHHLLVEILLKLPMISLTRFKCVSKSWLSLISDSYFTRTHLNQSKSITKRILVAVNRSRLYTVDLGSTHSNVIVAENIDYIFHIKPNLESLEIIGSCNGLVCIWFSFRLSYVIFNFYTRESKQIPYCNLRPYCTSFSICGFEYDNLSDDYKLVQLGRQSIYIYSLRAGFWKKVQDYVENSFCVEGMMPNGAIHWFCLDKNSNRKSKIVAFDLVGEKLTEIPLPSFFTNVHEICGIGVFGECLCVKIHDIDKFWVMKEYRVEQSWTKVHVEFPNSLYAEPLDLLNNDEILMRTFGFNLGLYNTSKRTYKDHVLHGLPKKQRDRFYDAIVYADSLVSPTNSFCYPFMYNKKES